MQRCSKTQDCARAVDLPIAALLVDLKRRGLLEDTIVWWGSEFGRTPYAEANGTGRLVRAGQILISTGSRPRRPTEVPFDGWRIVDADEVLRLEAVPRSLMIYGAGVIGCE